MAWPGLGGLGLRGKDPSYISFIENFQFVDVF